MPNPAKKVFGSVGSLDKMTKTGKTLVKNVSTSEQTCQRIAFIKLNKYNLNLLFVFVILYFMLKFKSS